MIVSKCAICGGNCCQGVVKEGYVFTLEFGVEGGRDKVYL